MNDSLLIALVVAVIGPILLSWLNNRHRRQERDADWARQDAVADQAAEAAALLLAAQEKTIAATDEVAVLAKQTAESTDAQLRQIHTLVNSDMTAARLNELTQTRATLAALRKIIRLDEDAGRRPTSEDLLVVETTEARIVELEAILADRAAQQKIAERDVAQPKEKPHER
jgi:uncharacterized membrane protein